MLPSKHQSWAHVLWHAAARLDDRKAPQEASRLEIAGTYTQAAKGDIQTEIPLRTKAPTHPMYPDRTANIHIHT